MIEGPRIPEGEPARARRPHRLPRAAAAYLHDLVMVPAAFVFALWLRLGDELIAEWSEETWIALGLYTAVAAGTFLATGLYKGIWRYASLNDLGAILKAVTLATLIFLLVTFLTTRLEAVPRSALVINWFVLVALLAAPRMAYRVYKDQGVRHLLERNRHQRVPVLLVGANDRAEVFIREMARDPAAPYEVLGVIDDKGGRVGRRIRDVPVMGDLDALETVVRRVAHHNRVPQRLILAKPLGREEMSRLLEVADAEGMTLARLPRLIDFDRSEGPSGTVARPAIELRPIDIEDLLGRRQARLDRERPHALVEGRRVLVTGAGGSIGSELVRQIAALGPSELALLDSSEYALYRIDLELAEGWSALPRTAILGDVRDRAKVEAVLARQRPEVVFHAAALKHVPLVEANPAEGILTNVIGTRIVAEECLRHGVGEMVLVSTDKAVNPPNVMGATKRLAESWCQALDLASDKAGDACRFVTVRFGNVLGSTGSVVPLFQRQLERGGPLTVTDPRVERYFMTTGEAVALILEAAALSLSGSEADRGRIYVLDMGEPVRIDELARQMIRLAGLRPDKDVEIVYTGLRPGEKLSEDLFHELEPAVATAHPGLRLASPRPADRELLARGLDELEAQARRGDAARALETLAHLVPEFAAARLGRPSEGPATVKQGSAAP